MLFLLFVLYENNETLRNYKRMTLGLRYDYQVLKQTHNEYVEKTRNLRQTTILAYSPTSKTLPIADIIARYTKEVDGDLSIFYKNLSTSESVTINANQPYYMASLYKVILTLYMLDGIKTGAVRITDAVGDPAITVAEALDKIVTESNNEYAQLLAERYGWKTIESAMKAKLSIEFSFDESLTTNAANIGALFEEIASSLRIDDTDSKYLLRLLRHQTQTSKLPKYLPQNVLSHNKTGEFGDYSHDAAIFYTPKVNYILIFMSKTKTPDRTNEHMAQMSKEIYTVLNGSY